MPNFSSVRRRCAPLLFGWWLRCLLVLAPLLSLAQGGSGVSGTVTTAGGTPLEFATVTLHRAADSTVVKTEFSDAKGGYLLRAAPGGYLVSAAQVGFERRWTPAFALTEPGLELPAIALPASLTLKEVTVTARKPLYERQADRTIVNVADSPLSSGATALDVLSRSPGVSLDGANNLALRGRQGVLLVVDGKRVPLTGEELASYLRALPAEQVQNIELITNPPAQYDAQGGAGVIALNLKKDQRLGTNGSANASYGRGEYGKFAAGLALNHRSRNLNTYGSYTYSNRRDFAHQQFDRQYVATAALPGANSTTTARRVLALQSHAVKVGADFTLTKRTALGVSLTGLLSSTGTVNESQTQVDGPLGTPAQRYRSTAVQDVGRPSGSANLNFRHAFADSASAATVAADADVARYTTTRQLALTTRYDEPLWFDARLAGDQRSDLTIGTVKADFSQPLPHRARLETGVKATRITTDNVVAFVNDGVVNPLISGNYIYYENVNAAYANLRGTAPKTTWQGGVRMEQTNSRTEVGGETVRERHYSQLFPSAAVQRTFNERHALGLSLARRIDRPSYAQLTPLRTYFDAVSYRAGNPDLVAQTSYNLELTHTYRQKLTTSLAYAQTDQPIVTVVQPSPDGGRLVVNRDVNLTTQDYLALTLTATLEPAKWWTLYGNGVFYYARFRGSLAGTALDRARPACLLTASNTFSLPLGWTAELSGTFQSSETFGFEYVRPRGQLLAGVQKSLWQKKGTLRLSVADVLYTAPIRATSTYDNFSESYLLRQDTRVATAAFTYRFGSGKVAAARKRTPGADEELRRAAGQ